MNPGNSREAVNAAWLIRLRWVAVCAQAVLVLVGGAFFGLPLGALFAVVCVGALFNVFLSFWSGSRPTSPALIATAMCVDTALLTGLLLLSGGPDNPFSVLYIVNVALAAVVLPPRRAWAVAALAFLCFAGLFVLPAVSVGAAALSHQRLMALHLKGMWLAFAVAAAVIVFFLQRLNRALAAGEAELGVARATAARRERLASLTTLAAGAAHELSTPLSTIALVARELERELQRRELDAAAEDARLIREQVERCRRTLLQLATDAGTSLGEAAQLRPLEELAQAALRDLPGRGRVQVQLAPRSGRARLPLEAVGRAVQGLLRNALAASRDDAAVTLRLAVDPAGAEICVEDRGAGMEPEVLARVGEPFFTTRPEREGMGLGVFVARSLAEELGGRFEVASRVGAGTQIRILLPCPVETAARES